MRGVVLRLASVLIGLVLAAILVELLLPIALDRGPCRGQVPFWRPSAAVGWTLAPNVARDAVVCDEKGREIARHRVEINALGLRDRPRTFEREPGRQRVVVLGDSYVEAMQVDLEETFLARLEWTTGAEMIDAGVSVYSTDNEHRAFVERESPLRRRRGAARVLRRNDVLEERSRLYLRIHHGLPREAWSVPGKPRGRSRGASRGGASAAHVAPAVPYHALARVARSCDGASRAAGRAAARAVCQDAAGPSSGAGRPELFGVYGAPETTAWRRRGPRREANTRDAGGAGCANGATVARAGAVAWSNTIRASRRTSCSRAGRDGAW